MKKKLVLSLVALLAVGGLTACSSKTDDTSASSSSTVKETTTEASSSSSSSSSAAESTVTYLTDEEIDKVQTFGDFKEAFKSLIDSYVADFDALIADAPDAAKTTLQPFRDKVVQTMDEQQQVLASQFAALGDDSTVIPDSARDTVITSLKTARDQLKSAMETARQQMESVE